MRVQEAQAAGASGQTFLAKVAWVAVPLALVLGLALLLELNLASWVADGSIRQILMEVCCYMIVALSLNVINGMAGQFSIGHAGFMALGAYSAAIVASNLQATIGGEPSFAKSFVAVPLSLLAAGLVAGMFGFLVGLPSLRLKGDYLAIVTLGFSEIIRGGISAASVGSDETIAQAWQAIGGGNGYVGPFVHMLSVMLTSLGGPKGYAGPSGGGVPLYAGPFWVVSLTALVAVAAWRLKFSGWGRALRALREDEIAGESVGVDPTRYKVTSFVLSALGGGLAGGLMAIMRDGNPVVQPDRFKFETSFDAITMVILGGSGSVIGAMLGGLFVTVTVRLIELVQGLDAVAAFKATLEDKGIPFDLNALRMILYASLLITLMILRPEGVFGEREPFVDRLLKRRAKGALS